MTAPDLLQAVGVTGGNNIDLFSVQGGETVTVREALAKQWAFADEQVIYTGPALDTPELDAILWVEGQRWCHDCKPQEYHALRDRIAAGWMTDDPADWLMIMANPGHALARAIKEVRG